MKFRYRQTMAAVWVGVVAVTAGAFPGALPLHAGELPPVQQTDGVAYLSGGIGLDESSAIEAESRKWPLTLLFAIKSQQRAVYAADVQVRLLDGRGQLLLETTSDGPYLLLKLAPGPYVVEASLQGKTLRQKVQLKPDSPARIVLVWPPGAADDGL